MDSDEVHRMISANGKQLEWYEGLTARDVLKSLGYNFPSVLVRVNGTIVKKAQWDNPVIPDGAEVEVRPIVAGG